MLLFGNSEDLCNSNHWLSIRFPVVSCAVASIRIWHKVVWLFFLFPTLETWMIVLNMLSTIHSFRQWPLILSPVSRLILIVMILGSCVSWKCFAGERWSSPRGGGLLVHQYNHVWSQFVLLFVADLSRHLLIAFCIQCFSLFCLTLEGAVWLLELLYLLTMRFVAFDVVIGFCKSVHSLIFVRVNSNKYICVLFFCFLAFYRLNLMR